MEVNTFLPINSKLLDSLSADIALDCYCLGLSVVAWMSEFGGGWKNKNSTSLVEIKYHIFAPLGLVVCAIQFLLVPIWPH